MAIQLRTAALLPLALLIFSACGEGASPNEPIDPAPKEAVVSFVFRSRPQDTLRVLVRHQATIAAAQQYIRTREGAHIPIGPIRRGAGPADPRYPFHFVPDSVRLAEITIELCDGAPMRTAAEVNAFIEGATGNANAASATYCPWSAYPVRVQ